MEKINVKSGAWRRVVELHAVWCLLARHSMLAACLLCRACLLALSCPADLRLLVCVLGLAGFAFGSGEAFALIGNQNENVCEAARGISLGEAMQSLGEAYAVKYDTCSSVCTGKIYQK